MMFLDDYSGHVIYIGKPNQKLRVCCMQQAKFVSILRTNCGIDTPRIWKAYIEKRAVEHCDLHATIKLEKKLWGPML
jgi:hypothetical protein